MALTIKQLNADSSFLLTFERIDNNLLSPTGFEALHVLLDPYIAAPSHSQTNNTSTPSFRSTSTAHQDEEQSGYISSLEDLPEPDLVVISSAKNDRCHEATLRQLPRQSTKMRILAEATAAKRIRSWRYFDKDMVETLPRWKELPRHRGPRQPREDPVAHIPIVPQVYGGDPGELTIAYISQKRGLSGSGSKSAIGITYRPPTTSPSIYLPRSAYSPDAPIPPCPPRIPTPELSLVESPASSSPSSPASSLNATYTSPYRRTTDRTVKSCATWQSFKTLSRYSRDRGVSVIFSPDGIPYSALEGYATTHLLRKAVLPLTALIQSFDSFSQPRWFRGAHARYDAPMGQETATKLGAKAWIGNLRVGDDKDAKRNSLFGKLARKKKYLVNEARETPDKQFGGSASSLRGSQKGDVSKPTEVLVLEAGEEIVMTSEGIWDDEPSIGEEDIAPRLPPPVSSKCESSTTPKVRTSTDSAERLSFGW